METTLPTLTEEQRFFYEENGYLLGMPPVFTEQYLMDGYNKLIGMLYEDEIPSDMMNWHLTSRWIYDVATHPQILNYVEGVLGPDFYFWSSDFIIKPPFSEKIVPWHQDAEYWAISEGSSTTVWIAFGDVDEGNGAMKVIPGTHKAGVIKHKIAGDASILSFELEDGVFNEADAVSLRIPAGANSLHDDRIIHGSPANKSDRWRIACVLRYTTYEVKADLTKVPTFTTFPVRGVDRFRHNPTGTPPTEMFARPAQTTKRMRKTN